MRWRRRYDPEESADRRRQANMNILRRPTFIIHRRHCADRRLRLRRRRRRTRVINPKTVVVGLRSEYRFFPSFPPLSIARPSHVSSCLHVAQNASFIIILLYIIRVLLLSCRAVDDVPRLFCRVGRKIVTDRPTATAPPPHGDNVISRFVREG